MIGYEILSENGLTTITRHIVVDGMRYTLPISIPANPGQFLVLMYADEWRELGREDEPLLKQRPRFTDDFWDAFGRLHAWARDFGHASEKPFVDDLQQVLLAIATDNGFGVPESPVATEPKQEWEFARDRVLSVYPSAVNHICDNGSWIHADGFLSKGYCDPPESAWIEAWRQIVEAAKTRVLKRIPSAGIRGDGSGLHWIEDCHGTLLGYEPNGSPKGYPDEQVAWVETDNATAHVPYAVLKTPEQAQQKLTPPPDYFPSTVSIATVDWNGVKNGITW